MLGFNPAGKVLALPDQPMSELPPANLTNDTRVARSL